MMTIEARAWMSTEQAAEYAGMHPETVRRACETGDLTAYQMRRGGRWRIHPDDVDTWIRRAAA